MHRLAGWSPQSHAMSAWLVYAPAQPACVCVPPRWRRCARKWRPAARATAAPSKPPCPPPALQRRRPPQRPPQRRRRRGLSRTPSQAHHRRHHLFAPVSSVANTSIRRTRRRRWRERRGRLISGRRRVIKMKDDERGSTRERRERDGGRCDTPLLCDADGGAGRVRGRWAGVEDV